MATGGEVNHEVNKILEINDLSDIIGTLERSGFSEDKWNELGLNLHIIQPKLNSVKANNPQDVKACLRECLVLWLEQNYDTYKYGLPTLELLATAVEEMGLSAVASGINQGSTPQSKIQSPKEIEHIIEVYSSNYIKNLRANFALFMADLLGQLSEHITNGVIKLIRLARFMTSLTEVADLEAVVTVDKLFYMINGHFSYLNYEYIEFVVKNFLTDEDQDLKGRMETYVKDLENFKTSIKLRQLKKALDDVRSTHSHSSCKVFIKLVGEWENEPLARLEDFLKHYFKKDSIFNLSSVTDGCLSVTFLVPLSFSQYLIDTATPQLKSMSRVGVLQLMINDVVLLDEKDDVNLNESLTEAVKIDDTFEVSLLLSLGADPCYENSNGDKVLELALQGGYEEIIELISIATDTQVMELESQEELTEKEDNKETSNNGTDEELEVIIQRLEDSCAELERSLVVSEKKMDELQLQKKKNETELQTSKTQLKKCYTEIDDLKVKCKEDLDKISSLEADVKVKEKTMSKQETEIATLQEAVSLASLQKKETEAELQKRLNAGYLENKRLDRLLAESKDESQVLLDKISSLEADVLSLKNELIIKEKMLFEETKSGTKEIEILQEKISSLSVQLLPPPSEDKFTQSEAIETMEQSVQSLKILLPEIDKNEMKIEGVLTVADLSNVLDLLKRCGFHWARWHELGLTLGLHKSTLDVIEMNNRGDVFWCFTECLSQWLRRADNVDSKGGTTFDSLSDALRSMNENAAADKLDQEINLKLLLALAVSLYDSYSPLMSESLSDPVNVAIMLQREGVIAGEVLTSVESASPSVPNQREVLLAAIREAVQRNYNFLHTFASVLRDFTDNIELGTALLQDYDKHLGTKIPDVDGKQGKKRPMDVLNSHFADLCEAIAAEHIIIRASSYCIGEISDDIFDKATTYTIPVYERAQAILMELRRNLKASNDQRQYLMQLISIFHKVKDPVLSKIADSMKSEL